MKHFLQSVISLMIMGTMLIACGRDANKSGLRLTCQTDNAPIAGALLLDGEGNLLGISDEDGIVKYDTRKGKPAFVWHYLHEPAAVATDANADKATNARYETRQIQLTPMPMTVDMKNAPTAESAYLRLRAVVVDHQFVNNRLDYYAEGVVSFLVPLNEANAPAKVVESMNLWSTAKPDAFESYIGQLPTFERDDFDISTYNRLTDGQPQKEDKDGVTYISTRRTCPVLGNVVDSQALLNKLKEQPTVMGITMKMDDSRMSTCFDLLPEQTNGMPMIIKASHSQVGMKTTVQKQSLMQNLITDIYIVEAEYLTQAEAEALLAAKAARSDLQSDRITPPSSRCDALLKARKALKKTTVSADVRRQWEEDTM